MNFFDLTAFQNELNKQTQNFQKELENNLNDFISELNLNSNSKKLNNLSTSISAPAKSNNLNFDSDQMSEIVFKIKSCINEIEEIWQDLEKNDITKINESWAAEEAKTYIEKIEEAGVKIKSINESLNILSDAYSRILNNNYNITSELRSVINKLN